MNFESKWITFQESVAPKLKTKTFLVRTMDDANIILGQIKWYAPWRKYSFFPQPNTVFENDCLKAIVDFISNLMAERRLDRQVLNNKTEKI